MRQNEKHYATLAPVMALAGVFAHPYAAMLIPLVLFFIYYWCRLEFAGLVALRAADLALTIQLLIFFGGVLLVTYVTYKPLPTWQVKELSSLLTFSAVIYLVISLVLDAIMAVQGKSLKNFLSLRIAERILHTLTRP